MFVTLTGKVIDITSGRQKSARWTSYFSFYVQDLNENWTKWFINKIKCYFITGDIHGWEELMSSLEIWDILHIQWTPAISLLEKSEQYQYTGVFMSIFCKEIEVIMRKSTSYEKSTNSLDPWNHLVETKLPKVENKEIPIVQQTKEEKENLKQEIQEVMGKIFQSDDNDLPFR